MTMTWEIRAPTPADAAALADLKIEWSAIGYEPTAAERTDFADALAEWMSRLSETLICRVAIDEHRIVGMAWMVVYERVPNFDDLHRLSGDVQSVYVEPEFRGRGIGLELVTTLCAEADRWGIPRVTVQSSGQAVNIYRRAGFTRGDNLLARAIPEA
jgi:GNAT superfamily N-acetyltransferase